MVPVSPVSTRRIVYPAVFHTRIVWSVEPAASRVPRGLKATARTDPVKPRRTASGRPSVVSHRWTARSWPPAARTLQAGRSATA